MDKNFSDWLSEYLKTDNNEAQKLLDNELSRYFLIVWSIYEAKCFRGFVKIDKMEKFVDNVDKSIEPKSIDDSAEYFHQRYKDRNNYRHLIHGKNNPKFEQIIKKEYKALTINEKIYLLVFVTYRYRNNIFHGNKGISSWLKFDEQIRKCIQILQLFIDASLATA